jgi:isoquinoline 1-oxidoreductase alpha subunit
MPTQSFVLNGERVTVDIEDDVRLLWVLRDVLGVTGPKYGCSGGICRACVCHVNGKLVPTCTVPVGDLRPTDQVLSIEGLAASVGKDLHPMQRAWIEKDVSQCGYCQPGQVMQAVALVREVQASGRKITDADLDAIRNVCRCGTYPRIREAIRLGESMMPAPKRRRRRKRTATRRRPTARRRRTARRPKD